MAGLNPGRGSSRLSVFHINGGGGGGGFHRKGKADAPCSNDQEEIPWGAGSKQTSTKKSPALLKNSAHAHVTAAAGFLPRKAHSLNLHMKKIPVQN